MKKIGIKKTWGNIIMLFIIGMVVGVVIGLRQPIPVQEMPLEQTIDVIALDVQNDQMLVQNMMAG